MANPVVTFIVKQEFKFRRNIYKVGKRSTVTLDIYEYLMKRYGFDFLEQIGGNEKTRAAEYLNREEE